MSHGGPTDGAFALVLDALVAGAFLSRRPRASDPAIHAMIAQTAGSILWFLA